VTTFAVVRVGSNVPLARRGDEGTAVRTFEEPQRSKRLWSRHESTMVEREPRRRGNYSSTMKAVTMPNIPSSRSAWVRMWQCQAHTPGSVIWYSTV
jgi:hypothetical protein